MAHALVSHVNLEDRRPEDAQRLLNDQVIGGEGATGLPARRVAPREGRIDGMAIVVFDSEEHVHAAMDGMGSMRPADGQPITSAAVYVVSRLA
jgi:hypothetical protein